MTDLEKQIIQLVEESNHLSADLKKKYILSVFFMDEAKQQEFLRLIQNFAHRCTQADAGIFILRPDEAAKMQNDFDSIKRDILKKIQSKNQQ